MRYKAVLKSFAAILFTTFALSAAPTTRAVQCSLAGVAGRYGYTSTGTIITPPVGAFAAVGHVTFTATGTFSGAQTTSVGGHFFDETVSGTFTVNPDCTGTAVVNVYQGTTLARTTNLNVVWDDSQRQVRAIFLTTGTAITIHAKKMFTEEQD
jgi:hypothetical protein